MDNNNDLKEFLRKNGFSLAICSTIAILLIATLYFSYTGFEPSKNNDNLVKNEKETDFEAVNKSDVKSYKENTTENITETTTKKQVENATTTTQSQNLTEKSTETTTNNTNNTNNKNNEQSKQDDKKQNNEQSNDETKVFSMFDENQEMSWPVSGQIVMDYSMETSIYDKTLDLYRTNDSICISSPEGTDVMASSEGIVENIFKDNEKGNTVVINHGNGWMSTYSQLQEEVAVDVGQVVKEGEIIGKIGAPSNYSVLLGPHLNFKITKDDASSDPKLVLAQLQE